MDSYWCTVVDGKEIPNWALKSPEERIPWEQFMFKVYKEAVKLAKEIKKDPDLWRKRVSECRPSISDNGKELYFDVYVSEDFVLDHLCGKYRDLDDINKSPLPGLSLRQIIICFYDLSIDKLRNEIPPQIEY